MGDPTKLSHTEDELSTLTDFLDHDLDIVFVGINPSSYSVREGHYFANPRNRFWPALNRSGLVDRELSPKDDVRLRDYRIGFTDVVKRPTPQASGLSAADFRQWVPVLQAKLLEYQPRIACFHGVTGYRAYLRYGVGAEQEAGLGLQERTIGKSRIFVVPNPSPANAQYSLDDLVYWYQQLNELRQELAG